MKPSIVQFSPKALLVAGRRGALSVFALLESAVIDYL